MNSQQNHQVAAIQQHKLNLFFEDQPVRIVIDDDNAPWWAAKDVCDVLGVRNSRQAVQALDEDELTYVKHTSGGQARELQFVSESGLYTLIFRSNKPQAKRFRRWVTAEVLPSIRKTGSYGLTTAALPTAFTPAQEERLFEIATRVALDLIRARYRLVRQVKPVSRDERQTYHHLLHLGRSVGSIARQFKRSPSTIRRHTAELRADLRRSRGEEVRS